MEPAWSDDSQKRAHLFQILNIPPDADSEAIQSAYRILSQRHHPNRPDSTPEDLRKFNEISLFSSLFHFHFITRISNLEVTEKEWVGTLNKIQGGIRPHFKQKGDRPVMLR